MSPGFICYLLFLGLPLGGIGTVLLPHIAQRFKAWTTLHFGHHGIFQHSFAINNATIHYFIQVPFYEDVTFGDKCDYCSLLSPVCHHYPSFFSFLISMIS